MITSVLIDALSSLGFIKALHKGEEIDHKEFWKNTQSLMNVSVAGLWIVAQVFPGLGLDEEIGRAHV